MRRLIGGVFVLTAGCASAGAPPGGPEDHAPPEIISISPDSGATNVKVSQVEFKFDEVVSDRPAGAGTGLDQIFLISPRNGSPNVSWHRSRITVKPRNGFRPNTAYRVTLMPGLADLRGNIRKDTRTIVFSTGASFPRFAIVGVVFDWAAQRVAVGAYVEAISHPDTSIVYLASTDTAGQFELGPLPQATYTVRALIDQNANRTIDRNEKWDSVRVDVSTIIPSVELDAIERDSLPAAIVNLTPIDSLNLRLDFDKPLDPSLPLQPAMIRLQRADSSQLEVTRVQWQGAFERQRQAQDSARRADSVRARQPAGPPPAAAQPPPPPIAVPAPGGPRPAPPPAKPKAPPPERAIVVTINPSAPLLPSATYRITVTGIRNLLGNSRDLTRTFTVPKPAPPRDTTTKRPPSAADSARRPPPPAARPPR